MANFEVKYGRRGISHEFARINTDFEGEKWDFRLTICDLSVATKEERCFNHEFTRIGTPLENRRYVSNGVNRFSRRFQGILGILELLEIVDPDFA